MKRFMERVEFVPFSTCWYWTGSLFSNGYGQTQYEGKNQKAHRVSYMIHKGAIPEGMCVCHTCDEKTCVNPNHLWLGTHLDNMRDKMKKGRHRPSVGEDNGCAKLTDEQVREIRSKRASGRTLLSIAREYGIGDMQVSRIYRREQRKTA